MRNPMQFIEEVRAETSKVTWPTRKEVWLWTVMVLIMVTLAAVYFRVIDLILGWGLNLILRG